MENRAAFSTGSALDSWWNRVKPGLDKVVGGKLAPYSLRAAPADSAASCITDVTLTLVGPSPPDAPTKQSVEDAFETEFPKSQAIVNYSQPSP